MSQLVTQPTRIANTGHANILDLILTNDPLSINIINYLPPFSTSDHLMIHFIIYYNSVSNIPDDTDLHETHLPKYDWSNGDYDKINECLFNIDWNLLFGYNFDINSLWVNFKSIIWPVIELYVPKKMIPHRTKYSPRFYPKHIRILLKRKAAIWRVLRSSHSSELYIKYCNIAHQCKSAIYEYDAGREMNLLNANNLGAFYTFINKKLHNSSDIAPLYNNTGSLLPGDLDKANILNSYFESVFIKDDGNLFFFPHASQLQLPLPKLMTFTSLPPFSNVSWKNLKQTRPQGLTYSHQFFTAKPSIL